MCGFDDSLTDEQHYDGLSRTCYSVWWSQSYDDPGRSSLHHFPTYDGSQVVLGSDMLAPSRHNSRMSSNVQVSEEWWLAYLQDTVMELLPSIRRVRGVRSREDDNGRHRSDGTTTVTSTIVGRQVGWLVVGDAHYNQDTGRATLFQQASGRAFVRGRTSCKGEPRTIVGVEGPSTGWPRTEAASP